MKKRVLILVLGTAALLLAGCSESTYCVGPQDEILTSPCLSKYSNELSVNDICFHLYALPDGDQDRLAVWSSINGKGNGMDPSPPSVRDFCEVMK